MTALQFAAQQARKLRAQRWIAQEPRSEEPAEASEQISEEDEQLLEQFRETETTQTQEE